MAAYAAQSLARVSLLCRCPRCGEGRLYQGLLTIRQGCPVCGLDLSRVDVGDGLVVPIIIVLGALVVGMAAWVEFHLSPPLWVHAVVWPLVTIPLAILMLRPAKAFLVAQQFRNRASEMGL